MKFVLEMNMFAEYNQLSTWQHPIKNVFNVYLATMTVPITVQFPNEQPKSSENKNYIFNGCIFFNSD